MGGGCCFPGWQNHYLRQMGMSPELIGLMTELSALSSLLMG